MWLTPSQITCPVVRGKKHFIRTKVLDTPMGNLPHTTVVAFNTLSRNSDQYQNSPCDINASLNRLVMRIKDIITQDTMS